MNLPRSDLKDKKRFHSKIKKTNGCWLYLGFHGDHSYGQFWSNGKGVLAHRFSYELNKEKIPKEMTIDHLCKIKNCVNPDHMEVVSLSENSHRNKTSQNNIKKKHCIRGHKFTIENTYIYIKRKGRKERVCRECKKILAEKYKKEKNGK